MASLRTLVAFLTLCAAASFAQHTHEQGGTSMPEMQHEGMHHDVTQHAGMQHDETGRAESFLMGESSGTGFQTQSWPMPMLMTRPGKWNLMWMGQAYLVETQQSGPRGGDKLYSPNWGMLAAVHKLGSGAVMLRSMLSLEPATVTNRSYPLLFQTGETAYGQALVDAQHPHDFVMELSAQYARPLGSRGILNVYYAPVGDPALGPVAYPDRASALEIPQATLGHHWQDSTHIANNVVTAGIAYGKVRLEASGFHGREPDEARWNIDYGGMDSWSGRLSVFPTRNWMGQFSIGRLTRPEALHPGDVVRTTASVQYIRPRLRPNYWASTFVWGQDHRTDTGENLNAVLAETVIPVRRNNFITARFEWSQRDELFENDEAAAEQLLANGHHLFPVSAITAGYTRDIPLLRNVQTGIGANASTYVIEAALQRSYGAHPWGLNIFIRMRLRPSE